MQSRADSFSFSEHPESFPVNTLVPIEGTPLEKNDVSIFVVGSGRIVESDRDEVVQADWIARLCTNRPSNDRYRPNRPA